MLEVRMIGYVKKGFVKSLKTKAGKNMLKLPVSIKVGDEWQYWDAMITNDKRIEYVLQKLSVDNKVYVEGMPAVSLYEGQKTKINKTVFVRHLEIFPVNGVSEKKEQNSSQATMNVNDINHDFDDIPF